MLKKGTYTLWSRPLQFRPANMRIHWSRLADNDFNVTIATVAALQDTKETDYQLYVFLCEHLQLVTWLGIMPYYRKTKPRLLTKR
jgi:hypothetical protein